MENRTSSLSVSRCNFGILSTVSDVNLSPIVLQKDSTFKVWKWETSFFFSTCRRNEHVIMWMFHTKVQKWKRFRHDFVDTSDFSVFPLHNTKWRCFKNAISYPCDISDPILNPTKRSSYFSMIISVNLNIFVMDKYYSWFLRCGLSTSIDLMKFRNVTSEKSRFRGDVIVKSVWWKISDICKFNIHMYIYHQSRD